MSPPSPRARWLYAGAFALALGLAFPFRAGEFQFDVGPVVGWGVVWAFVAMLGGLSPRRAFVWATGAASAGFAVVLFWLYVVVVVHGHAAPPIGVLAVIGMALVFGLHTGAAGAAIAWLAPDGRALWFVAPSVWVIAEHLRSFDFFGGFPWAYLGYAIQADGPMLELASIGGVWGLSFLLAAVGVALAQGRYVGAMTAISVAHALGFGLRLLALDAETPAVPLHAGIIQGNVAQDQKWDPAVAKTIFDRHVELSRFASAAGAELVVWPEASVPVALDREPAYREALSALARDTGSMLVVGAMALEWESRDVPPRFFNSAFLIDPTGRYVDRYDKTHLVPFGEYVPLRVALGALSGIATGLSPFDLTPGAAPRVLTGIESLRGHAPAVLICYEVIYPDLVRRAVRDGARVLLNVTNDAWYGKTSAPHQFLAIAAMRSAEHGIPMLRAANTGVSAVIDAGGVVLEKTALFESATLRVSVPPARKRTTVYTRFGDWVVGICWVITIAIGGYGLVRGRRHESSRNRGRSSSSG